MSVRLLLVAAAVLAAQPLGAAGPPSEGELLLQRAIQKERVDGDLKAALKLYESVLETAKNDRPVAAEALLRMGQCHEKLGHAQARAAYERLVRDYPEQAEKVQVARQRLSALDSTRASGPVARRLYTGNLRALSPDGRYVVHDDNGNLRLEDLRTGKDTAITNDPSRGGERLNYTPVAISPDGKRVAYTWEAGGANELRVSALDGSAMRALHRSANEDLYVLAGAWTPDGQKLIVLESDGYDWRRGFLDLKGGSLQYAGERQRRRFTRWGVPSPDGRFIAYDVGESEDPLPKSLDVLLYDTVAERDVPVASGPTNDKVVGWSSTGRELLFLRSSASSRDVWSVTIENGKPEGDLRLVKRDLGNGDPLQLTPNGVLYQKLYKEDVYAFVAEFDISTGKVTLPARSVNERREQSGSPRWSADGLSFFYGAVDPSTGIDTLVIRSDPSGVERRMPVGHKLNYPGWIMPSPDGRRVALGAFDKEMNYGVFLIDPAGGTIRRIIELPKENFISSEPSWSPDGKAIYYKRRATEAADAFVVLRRDLETGAEQQVYQGTVLPQGLTLSPDGTRFAFLHGRPHVLVTMGGAGEMKELDRAEESVELQAPAWSADGQRILYCKIGKDGSDLWWVPAGGGTPERLAHLGQSIFTLAMDPAGKRIAWTAKSTTSELWALDNLLSR
jgi:Tol biopolymer transport system component